MIKFFWQHWLDLVVIGAIVAGVFMLLQMRSQRQTQWVMVQIKVSQEEWWWQANGPEYWYGQNLIAGTEGHNSFGETVAELVKIESSDAGLARNRVIIWTKLRVNYDEEKNEYIFGFQPLQVGKGIELSFGPQQIKGLVVGIGQEIPAPVERLVEIKVFQLDPKAAESLKKGLENKNSAGETVLKIEALEISQTVRSEFSDIRGRMVQVDDPNFVQIWANIRMRVTEDGERYITSDGQPLKIGGEIALQFPQTVLTRAVVLDIKPVLPQ